MTIREIVAAYLREHGHDGLAGEDCGCTLDDLMPCDEVSVDHCTAGKRVPCPGVREDENGCAYGGGCPWHVVPATEEPKTMPENHPEKVGHCRACAAELEQLAGRVQRLEDLLEDLDGTLSRYIRATPATPRAVATAETLPVAVGDTL
jgi:hypothetical protein